MLEKVAYSIFGVLAVLWLGGMIFGMIAALPWGIIGLVALVAVALLLVKVLKERLNNKEDDYYSENVDQ